MTAKLTETNQSVADRLSEFMKLKPVAMLGAGVSADCFPKSWDELIQILSQKMGIQPKSTTNLNRAQELKDADETKYTEALREIFTKKPEELPATLLKLTQLPFKHYVTHNFDRSISEARGHNTGVAPQEQFYPKIALADCTDGSVTYAHGAFKPDGEIEDIDFIVLHTKAYIKAYKNNGSYSCFAYDFFRFVFKNEHILFVGIGLNDEAMQTLLEESSRSNSQKIILFPKGRYTGEHKVIKDLHKRAYNIEVLFYDAVDSDHSGLTSILEVVHNRIVLEPKIAQNTLQEGGIWE
ncbi:SIR2 family protein [Rubellicoccus peritrichatus]|uniref:SIR2 family protein n=1 Tax=Rubellicoccus peritrichatus TaxID=3080537 RepID=A0AAQ3LHV0_9BACT|nr:SIR2 family protein [Puniceicoccus sp. CR14]WOO42364.1 SIR2 family protein [Puniceicoccus sp. CR14]